MITHYGTLAALEKRLQWPQTTSTTGEQPCKCCRMTPEKHVPTFVSKMFSEDNQNVSNSSTTFTQVPVNNPVFDVCASRPPQLTETWLSTDLGLEKAEYGNVCPGNLVFWSSWARIWWSAFNHNTKMINDKANKGSVSSSWTAGHNSTKPEKI